MRLFDLIVESAEEGLLNQKGDGSMPPGRNGPYHDEETPVRNTSHWLITFVKAYYISKDRRFREAARRATDYLLSREARPMGATFWHRKNPEKDSCNGLIGQAWTIEALVAAAEFFDSEQPVRLAEDVFLVHPFVDELGLWCRVASDGRYLPVDYTLNHQIWFAAAGSLLTPYADEEVRRRVDRFMEGLTRHFQVHRSGLVKHLMATAFSWKKSVKKTLRRVLRLDFEPAVPREKEIGYHQFNLYGLSLLYKRYADHRFWTSSDFRRACQFVRSEEYREEIVDSPYGFPYNPPGFEVPLALDTFSFVFGEDTREEQARWVSEQIARCYDSDSNFMGKNCPDPNTQAARMYEATRLSDLKVQP